MEKLVLAMGYIKKDLEDNIEENKAVIALKETPELDDYFEAENKGLEKALNLVKRALEDYQRRSEKKIIHKV